MLDVFTIQEELEFGPGVDNSKLNNSSLSLLHYGFLFPHLGSPKWLPFLRCDELPVLFRFDLS